MSDFADARRSGELRTSAASLAAWTLARARALPRESCGALLGRRLGADDGTSAGGGRVWIVEALEELENLARDTHSFELDPGAIVAAHARAARSGLELLGFWHSHVGGDARPSRADANATWAGHVLVIVGEPAIGAWERCDDAWNELALVVAQALDARRCA